MQARFSVHLAGEVPGSGHAGVGLCCAATGCVLTEYRWRGGALPRHLYSCSQDVLSRRNDVRSILPVLASSATCL